ncbi:hypothetical protein [Streptomyces sp. Wb2n-11]|nr:hypothetical protein [Streptomyces sp. Wb2n-11]
MGGLVCGVAAIPGVIESTAAPLRVAAEAGARAGSRAGWCTE